METHVNKLKFSSIILMLFGIGLFAQTSQTVSDKFIRVFNLNGKKVAKGYVTAFNDSILRISRNRKEIIVLSVFEIGKIKTKRSRGHNVLVGAAAGGAAGAMLGVVQRDDSYWTEGETVLISGAVFGILGGAIGGISGLAKSVEIIEIDGDPIKWKNFISAFTIKTN